MKYTTQTRKLKNNTQLTWSYNGQIDSTTSAKRQSLLLEAIYTQTNKKGQLSLTNPCDTCETFAWFM